MILDLRKCTISVCIKHRSGGGKMAFLLTDKPIQYPRANQIFRQRKGWRSRFPGFDPPAGIPDGYPVFPAADSKSVFLFFYRESKNPQNLFRQTEYSFSNFGKLTWAIHPQNESDSPLVCTMSRKCETSVIIHLLSTVVSG